ncbi:MAG: hypothetical protein KAU21_15640, partial [Gammaproteobacteria bacterium]|nr:hypothetical protein [Gammaproteobacteria bacterium]
METFSEMNRVDSTDDKHGAVLQSPGILSLLILLFSMLFLTSCGGGGDATDTNTDASLSSVEIS